MSSHYFSKDAPINTERFEVFSAMEGEEYRLVSGHGVFSATGLDYGTRLLLECVIKEYPTNKVEHGARVADLGCGIGWIGCIIGCRYPTWQVELSDVNQHAVALSRLNVQAMQLSNCHVFEREGLDGVENNAFNMVLLNPPIRAGKETIFALYQDAQRALKIGGSLWVVIQKKQGAFSTKAFLSQSFGNCELMLKNAGFHVYSAIKERNN